MIVYSCQKCKWLDIGEEGEAKICMKCNSKMLSLGVTTVKWNSFNDTQKENIINNITEKNKSLDDSSPIEEQFQHQDDVQSQGSVTFHEPSLSSNCKLDEHDYGLVNKIESFYKNKDYSSVINLISEFNLKGKANPYISLYLGLIKYRRNENDSLDEAFTNVMESIDASISVLKTPFKTALFILDAVIMFIEITTNICGEYAEEITSIYNQATESANSLLADLTENYGRIKDPYVEKYKTAMSNENHKLQQNTFNRVSLFMNNVVTHELAAMNLMIYAFNTMEENCLYKDKRIPLLVLDIVRMWDKYYLKSSEGIKNCVDKDKLQERKDKRKEIQIIVDRIANSVS